MDKTGKEKSNKKHNVISMANIDNTASIHPQAEIGKNVKIGPYSTIGKNVEIGDNTVVGPHVVIKGRTVIGKNNEIYHGSAIGLKREDIIDNNTETEVRIGKHNIIRENVTIYRGNKSGTMIGNNNFIMAYCHFGNDCQLGDNIVISNAAHFSSEVVVENQAVIAGLSEIKSKVRIGKIVMVGAHTRVDKDIPPYILVDGHPAQVKNINVIGLRRNKFKPVLRKKIKKVYKIMYHSDIEFARALNKIKAKFGDIEEINYFINFLEKSKSLIQC